MAIRKNEGAGESPFVIDKISPSNVVEYANNNAQAKFLIFNAIEKHAQLPNYDGSVNFYLTSIDDSPEISALNYGEFSDTLTINDDADYQRSVAYAQVESILLRNVRTTICLLI
jgi:hypothetical protein